MTKKNLKKLIRKYLNQIRKDAYARQEQQHKEIMKDIKQRILRIGRNADSYDIYVYLEDEIDFDEKYYNLSKNEVDELHKFLYKEVYNEWVEYWKYKSINENIEVSENS